MSQHSEDALDAFLRQNRPEVPPGLARRLAAAARDPSAQRRVFWADAADAARQALRVSAAALVLASGLAFGAARDGDAQDEQLAVLSPSSELRIEAEQQTLQLLGEE